MRLVSISNCKSGMIIAKPIYQDNGKLLIGRGLELSSQFIKRLGEQGIGCLYIQDEATEDVLIDDVVPIEIRQQATIKIRKVFMDLQQDQRRWKGNINQGIKVYEFRDMLDSLLKEMKSSRRVMNLLTNIHVNDNYVFNHSLNVTLYTLAMAIKAQYNEKQLLDIGVGALLHDIGKMMIPGEVLHKPGRLTDEEFDLMKKHTEYGYDLLRKEYEISLVSAHCAFQHHEKWNGKGYPRGLQGKEIHPFARMMAVADVFDALTTHRVYRKAMLPHEAMEIIFADTNTHFDPDMVDLFRQSVAIYPIGITVKLSTEETAVVVDQNANSLGRPIVRVLKNPAGELLTAPYEIDLSKHLSIMITECDAILN